MKDTKTFRVGQYSWSEYYQRYSVRFIWIPLLFVLTSFTLSMYADPQLGELSSFRQWGRLAEFIPMIGVFIALFFLLGEKSGRNHKVAVSDKEILMEMHFPKDEKGKSRTTGIESLVPLFKLYKAIPWSNITHVSCEGKCIRILGKGGIPLLNPKKILIPLGFEGQEDLAKEIVDRCPKEALKCSYEAMVGGSAL